MLTVGLAHDLVISSVAVVRDGQVVAAIAEERLNRQKAYKGFPTMALKECLRMAGATLADVDCVAQGWNPMRHIEFPNMRQSNNARFRAEYLYSVPNMLMGIGGVPSGEWVNQTLDGINAQVRYYDHQLTHAANAFYLSRFDHAAVFSADGRGETETVYFGRASDRGFEKLGNVLFPHSLGLLYGAITQFLGYRPDNDEWKVMAMASFGNPDSPYYNLLRPIVDSESSPGQFFVDQRYVSLATPESQGGRLYTRDFEEAFGEPRGRDDAMDQRHMDIARAVQRVFEESMTTLLTHVQQRTGERRLAAAGGCMMNSVYNGKITAVTPFEEVFISSCPDDSGISIGAALLAYHELAGGGKRPAHTHNYWGPAYDEQIEKTLRAYKMPLLRLSDPAKAAAELVAAGHLVGWYQGRMEFGQRALGNRSILADPRSDDAKDIVNAAVKYRESYRPFAPAILADRVSDYFDAPDTASVPFMERVYMFRPEMRDVVPAVVHVDGSGRLQTVDRENNPRFYDLISHFEKLTGVPIVLNTSFNLNGEPIVCSPTDALRTFFSCGLDDLVLGDFVVTKRHTPTIDRWIDQRLAPAKADKFEKVNGEPTVEDLTTPVLPRRPNDATGIKLNIGPKEGRLAQTASHDADRRAARADEAAAGPNTDARLRNTVEAVVREILAASGRTVGDISDEDLLSSHIGLDSLDLAQLVVALQQSLGIDPFRTRPITVRSFGELVALYCRELEPAT